MNHRCPDCGRLCDSAAELADHALYVHVDAPTPAAHIRPQRFSGAAAKVAIGIAVLFGVGFWAVGIFGQELLNADSAPLRPSSVVHDMALDLERSGDVDEFRSIEPEEGWEIEYEFDDGDGYIRIRNEGTRQEDLEYETFLNDEMYEAMQDVLRSHGFRIEE